MMNVNLYCSTLPKLSLLICLMCVWGCQARDQDNEVNASRDQSWSESDSAAKDIPSLKKLEPIKKRLQAGERITQEDKMMLFSAARSSNAAIGVSGTILLTVAAHQGFVEGDTVEQLIMELCVEAQSEAMAHLRLSGFEFLNKTNKLPTASFEQKVSALEQKSRKLDSMSEEERQLILEALSSQHTGDSHVAGNIAVAKMGLNDASKLWLIGQIERKIAGESESERKYWRFVLEVVRQRNAGNK